MTNFSHGREAEKLASDYLKEHGYKILANNWRNKYCEIDIVAKKGNDVYFVEVKYRQNTDQGRGLEYITPKKIKQMELAARFWLAENDYTDGYCLSAVEVSGENYEVTNFLESIS